MSELNFNVYFNNRIIQCEADFIEKTDQVERWKVWWFTKGWDKKELLFQNNKPLLEKLQSRKQPHWQLLTKELLNIDYAFEMAVEISLALNNAIIRSSWKPFIGTRLK